MELLQLQYFCDAAQTQNFSKTARKFQVPPSDISQSIKRLERELSVHLFTRTANRITLNDRGQAFYIEARKALEILGRAVDAASGSSMRGTMRVGIHINRRTVMEAIERFQLQYSGVTIITSHEIGRNETDFDVLVSDWEQPLPGLVREKLFRENIVLAAQKGTFTSDAVPEYRPWLPPSRCLRTDRAEWWPLRLQLRHHRRRHRCRHSRTRTPAGLHKHPCGASG